MAEGFLPAGANTALDALLAAYPWVKAHIGAPGSAGTANPAAETTRKQASFSAASGGAATTSANLVWSGVSTSEDWTHVTGWSASTAGTVGWSAPLTADALVAGNTMTINAGDLDVSLTLAS